MIIADNVLRFEVQPPVGGSDEIVPVSAEQETDGTGLSATRLNIIAEAKRHIAAAFGVSPEAIEITIRG